MALLTLLKGLPMTYNRDLQEDKERLFDTADTVRACVRLMSAMLQHTSVNNAACLAAASDPALLATDLADYLVQKGMPFRKAHHVVGAVVALAEGTGKPLNQLTLARPAIHRQNLWPRCAGRIRSERARWPNAISPALPARRKWRSSWRDGGSCSTEVCS